jgi:hypothetical protein
MFLYRLPRGIATRPDRPLTIAVRVDHEPYLVETVRLLPGQEASRTVVELFSSAPDRLEELRALAEDGRTVELEISVGGVSTEIASLEALLARGDRLIQERPLPLSVESTVISTAPREEIGNIVGASTTCEDQCWDERDWCYENRCDFGGPPSCLDACDNQFEDCLESCEPPPPCEPTTEIVYVTEPQYYSTLRIDCFYDVYYPWDGWEFEEQLWTFKRTEKRITHNCDGSDTVEILSVTYFSDYCYYRLYWSCSGPFIQYRLNSCWY